MSPQFAQQHEKSLIELKKARTDLDMSLLDQSLKVNEALGELDATWDLTEDPNQKAAVYPGLRAKAIQLLGPQAEQSLPPEYTPETAASIEGLFTMFQTQKGITAVLDEGRQREEAARKAEKHGQDISKPTETGGRIRTYNKATGS